ncbi:hypothetical protein HYT58_00915, partial [Candidatus Woesearchaeota archaeon]|nr:hypothetical protein [Candidatus Woesearchaeota archaeon]
KENSVLLTRTLNWVIGDPERKSESFVSIGDTKINEPAEILYKGPEQPVAENVVFYKVGDDIYSASIFPDSTGFNSLLGATFAVNYNKEYERVGLNPGLQEVVGLTGGKMFDTSDIDGIVEQARTLSKRVVFGKVYYRWPFILAAILLFLLEIFIRRLSDSKTKEEVVYERY